MGDRPECGERKAAFITGAASGIGRATAELLAEKGWWIGAADRNAEPLAKLRDDLGHERCRTWTLDVTDKPACDTVVAEFSQATGGRMDLLFNNAGIAATGFFEDIPLAQTLAIIDTNLVGVIHGIHAALPLLKRTPNSLCFTTSSSAATYAAPRLAVYSATKFAVKGLTEALAVEFSRFGVRVADVLPGVIDTGIFGTSHSYVDGKQQPTTGAISAAAVAAKDGPFRLIAPREVADAVWRSYEGDPRMHWYVPAEIEDIERAKATSADAMRDSRIAMLRSSLGHGSDERMKGSTR